MKNMNILTDILQIDVQQWENLVATSPTATWFQTREAYEFFASLPDIFTPFVVTVKRNQESRATNKDSLIGMVVGYVTKEKNRLKQFFTRRAIIIGGPLLAEDIVDEELSALLTAVRQHIGHKVIYVETRNFNDYSRWKDVFEACGFSYQSHLNFHINTTSMEEMCGRMGKSRKRDIKAAEKAGATFVENPTLEQVQTYYTILDNLYLTKIKTPLFPFVFFEKLWKINPSYFMLIEQGGEIISGTVIVRDNHAMYEWFACGKQSHTYPTYCGMLYAVENGLKRYDMMGAGKPDEDYGVRDFKSQFGGELVEHGRYLCVCNKVQYKIGKLGVKILKR